MDLEQQQIVTNEPIAKSSKTGILVAILLTFLITAVITGITVFVWQQMAAYKQTLQLQQQVSELQNQIHNQKIVVTPTVEPATSITPSDTITGHYELATDPRTYLDVQMLSQNKLKIQGEAIYGDEKLPSGTHVGQVGGTVTMSGDKATYQDSNLCELTMMFVNGKIQATDNKQCGGVNVSFNGEYIKKSSTIEKWTIFDSFGAEAGTSVTQ